MGRSTYGDRFDHDYGDYIDDNAFTFGTFLSWMVLYVAYKNGASPFTLYMLANNLRLPPRAREGDAATEVDTADTEVVTVVTVGAEACSSKSTTFVVVVATTFLFLIIHL